MTRTIVSTFCLLVLVLSPLAGSATANSYQQYEIRDPKCLVELPESGCFPGDLEFPGTPDADALMRWGKRDCTGTTEKLQGEAGGEAFAGAMVGPIKIGIGVRSEWSGDYAIHWNFSCSATAEASAYGSDSFYRRVQLQIDEKTRATCSYSGLPYDDSCETPWIEVAHQGYGGSGVALIGEEYPTQVEVCWDSEEIGGRVRAINQGWQDIGNPVVDDAETPECENVAIDYEAVNLLENVYEAADTLCTLVPNEGDCLPVDPESP